MSTCTQRGKEEIHASLPLFFVCFFVFIFVWWWAGGVVERGGTQESILQTKKLRHREGQEHGQSYSVSVEVWMASI